MTVLEISNRYLIDASDFIDFLKNNYLTYSTTNLGEIQVEDYLVEQYVAAYRTNYQYRMNLAAGQQGGGYQQPPTFEDPAQIKAKALSEMLISSGFNFEGYRIVKYSGYISGDDATQIPRTGIFSNSRNGENLTNALVNIRRQALAELKDAAYMLGCNAVIGVDFDYITLEPETANFTGGTHYEPYIICVTANGNAVVIEKIEE